MLVTPIWIDPLFNKFGPMKDKGLEAQILALADRAGIEGSRVFEVDKSVDTKAVNAYVTGFLGTKRIVLWDTLLAKLDEPEVLFVMGHEMGHYVLGHVVRSILLSSMRHLLGLFLVDRVGRWLIAPFRDRLGFDRLSDIASVPLVLMLLEVASLVLSPVALAYSRYQEHEADRFALELTHANHSAAHGVRQAAGREPGQPPPRACSTRSSGPATRASASGSTSATAIIPGSRNPFSQQRDFTMARPDPSEYGSSYEKYISLVPEVDILEAMRSEIGRAPVVPGRRARDRGLRVPSTVHLDNQTSRRPSDRLRACFRLSRAEVRPRRFHAPAELR